MDPPLCGMAWISHYEVSDMDSHVTARRRVRVAGNLVRKYTLSHKY